MAEGVRGQPVQPLGRALRRGAAAPGGGRARPPRRLSAGRRLAVLLLALLGAAPALRAQAPPADTLRAGSLTVVHAPHQRALALAVARAAATPLPLPGLGAAPLPDSTTVLLAGSEAAWRDAVGMAPPWAGGVAFPGERTMVLPTWPGASAAPERLPVTFRHEWAHLVLHERLPGRIPRWFDEGYAEIASGGWDVERAWQLRVAFALGRVPPLDSLTLDWPRGEADARFAYLLSATAVEHLRRVGGGDEGFARLLARWREEGSLDLAIRRTYGMTLGQFEESWKEDVKNRYGWLLALSTTAVLWGAAAAITLVAWLPRRRRDRRRLEALRAEERMLPAPAPDGADVVYPLAEYPADAEADAARERPPP